MENSLYYTFSSISQVLAAFIALSGVFVLFKVQEYKKILFMQAQSFYCYLSGLGNHSSFYDCPAMAVDLKNLRDAECLGGIEDEMNQILEKELVKNDYRYKSLLSMRDTFISVDKKRISMLNWTKTSIISGILTIFYSILILSIVPDITHDKILFIYILGFIGCGISIVAMTIGILITFHEKNYIKFKKPSR